ncbi:E3 ubiquitin-protein ligase TRIM9-like isoform X2 [Octopus vulgaris]|uniref:E3 ubiquitin-protein ligase TRIM9-like isoform X2 n=1 Tax=Octopus vulgaris TaxID=6645 RepID=A0AA36F9U9_OCTVU|nr:E3 ubiquitin-protein ligase TRIM9-like isoform X2 [Octopus vulgaris]
MEEELKCPVCSRYFCNPVLLPCFHSLCMVCAVQIQELLPPFGQQSGGNCGNSNSNSTVGVLDEAGAVSVGSEQDLPDIDKLSIVSETDSGVICNSRPNSYIGSLGFGNIFSQASSGTLFSIRCPVCKKIIYLDEHGVQALPKSSILESIIEKFGCGSEEQTTEDSDLIKCQLCEQDSNDAACMCEQCEVFYCDSCRERCHPFRGPLAKHKLVSPCQGQMLLKKNKTKESKCQEHVDEQLSMFCQLCKVPVCYVCAQEGRHINHDVQALGVMCKTQKNELSQNLQSLSEKAKSGTIFIQRLKSMTDRVEISNALINRVSTADENFNREIELTARVSPKFELGFDNEHILQSIENMDFYEMKAPGQPVIIPEDCSAENNSVTIAWQPHPSGIVETFTLELDDGNSGDFRVVYVGRETMCTVDGLHFNSIYNARVKAHNNVGESNFSEMVSLQTAEGFAVPFACLNVASNQWHRFV